MTKGYVAEQCACCNHQKGDHKSNRAQGLTLKFGRCLTPGCDCTVFTVRVDDDRTARCHMPRSQPYRHSEREFFASRVEAMARWLYEQEGESDLSEYPPRTLAWDELSDASRDGYRATARDALKAVDGEGTA